MQRRGGSGQPVKGQSANRPKARNAPTAQVSTADLQEQLDRRTRERDEALEQQSATVRRAEGHQPLDVRSTTVLDACWPSRRPACARQTLRTSALVTGSASRLVAVLPDDRVQGSKSIRSIFRLRQPRLDAWAGRCWKQRPFTSHDVRD